MAKWKYPKPVNKTLKFGIFAETPIRNIPTDYLEWIIRENVCPGPISETILEVLANRILAIEKNRQTPKKKNKSKYSKYYWRKKKK